MRTRIPAILLSALCAVLWVRPSFFSEEPKLVQAKHVFKKGQEPRWKTPRQYSRWAMRLSPDGEHLLYPRAKGEPTTTPEGTPDWDSVLFLMVLRNLTSGKETVLPVSPLESGWRTVFTRFNVFDPSGKKLALADIDSEKKRMQIVLYDVAAGKSIPTSLEGGMAMAKFDRRGNGLFVMKTRSMYGGPPSLFSAELPDLAPVQLTARGFLQSVCPTADVICVWTPPERRRPPSPGERPERGKQRLFLYDTKNRKEIVELSVHQRNSQLDDLETQWTSDGQYLYYIDVTEVMVDTPRGPRERTRPRARIWDRQANKEAGQVLDRLPVGPGPTATSMVLAKRGEAEQGFVLHDAKSGEEYRLGDHNTRLVHASGSKVVFTRLWSDGRETLYVAEIAF